MECEAVIFDLDGTLADTLADIAGAMDAVLARRGFPGHSLEEYRYLVGGGLRDLVTRALPVAARGEEQAATALAEMVADYGARCLETTRLYDGVAALLRELRREGLKLAVLSNKADELTRRIVAGLAPAGTFDVVAGALPGVPLKPDPTAALLVAAELGVAPERVLYVGDSGVDMRTATAAGMYPVGVTWGLRGRDELEGNGARAVVDDPCALLGLLR